MIEVDEFFGIKVESEFLPVAKRLLADWCKSAGATSHTFGTPRLELPYDIRAPELLLDKSS